MVRLGGTCDTAQVRACLRAVTWNVSQVSGYPDLFIHNGFRSKT